MMCKVVRNNSAKSRRKNFNEKNYRTWIKSEYDELITKAILEIPEDKSIEILSSRIDNPKDILHHIVNYTKWSTVPQGKEKIINNFIPEKGDGGYDSWKIIMDAFNGFRKKEKKKGITFLLYLKQCSNNYRKRRFNICQEISSKTDNIDDTNTFGIPRIDQISFKDYFKLGNPLEIYLQSESQQEWKELYLQLHIVMEKLKTEKPEYYRILDEFYFKFGVPFLTNEEILNFDDIFEMVKNGKTNEAQFLKKLLNSNAIFAIDHWSQKSKRKICFENILLIALNEVIMSSNIGIASTIDDLKIFSKEELAKAADNLPFLNRIFIEKLFGQLIEPFKPRKDDKKLALLLRRTESDIRVYRSRAIKIVLFELLKANKFWDKDTIRDIIFSSRFRKTSQF